MIKQLNYNDLPEVLSVIHKSFATVAVEFNITRENCPNHTSFMKLETLQKRFSNGELMFAVHSGDEFIGFVGISDAGNGTYELHNLAVLPEYRQNGYGKMLIDYAKEKVRAFGGQKITIGIIEENTRLMNWYTANGFVHTGTRKFDHLPFTVGFMEWRDNK